MTTDGSPRVPLSPQLVPETDEIVTLIETLHHAEQRIQSLTKGQVDAVSNHMGRTFLLQRAQERLRLSESVKQAAILNALPAHIALLDPHGCIAFVNDAWSRADGADFLQGPGHGVGLRYLDACDQATGPDMAQGSEVAAGLRSILAGGSRSFSAEYAFAGPDGPRWFQLSLCPLAETPPAGVVVMHLDITERVQARESMQRSAELLRAVSAGIPDLVSVQDREGRYLLCNEAFANFVGRPIDQVVGHEHVAIFGPHGAREIALVDERVMRLNESVSSEEVLTGAAGTTKTFLSTKAPYRDASGQVIGVIGVSRDITERMRDEQALRESKALLSMAGRLAQVGSWVVDLPAVSVEWSDILASMHGEAAGSSLSLEKAFSYHVPAYRDAMRAAFETCVTQGTSFDAESQVTTATGNNIWVRAIGEAVRGPDGEVRRVQGALQDITRLKEAERETHLLAARLSSTLESITDGFLTLDRQWRYTYLNGEAVRMLGRNRSDLIGRVMWNEFPLFLGTDFERGYRRGMQACEGTTFDAFYEPWQAWINVHCYPSEEGLSIYFRDVTELKLHQDSLRELNADLEVRVQTRTRELNLAREGAEQANRAKSAFLAAMSHEIRTPMNGVVGMIDVLEQSNLRSHQADIVRTIRESAYALLGIVDDVLDFSKIEAGHLLIENEPFSVEQVVERVCDTLDHLSSSKGVVQQLFVDPAIPAYLLGDAARLRQILINLVGNAVKFSSAEGGVGKVKVRAMLVNRMGEGGSVVDFSVTDNGIGMDATTLSRLFTPFTQADDSTTKRFGGTGLGLSISSRLVQLMGGEIRVQSELGEGSTFTVQLSFGAVPGLPAEASPRTDTGLVGLPCLLVGLSPSLSEDLSTYLADSGASVHSVASQVAAGDWFEAASPGPHVVVFSPADKLEAEWLADRRSAWNASGRLSVGAVLINRAQGDGGDLGEAGELILNGHALHRDKFLHAVALASGRMDPEIDEDPFSFDGETAPAPLCDTEAAPVPRLILVAEDNEINQRVMHNQLALLGLGADIVENGTEALARWCRGEYALLLTDLHMPSMDGYELCSAIRRLEPEGQRMPIVALTANALKGEAKRCKDLGMDDYMIKPLQLCDLHAMLQKWMPASAKPIELRKSGGKPGPGRRSAANDAEASLPAADLNVLVALVGNDAEVIHELVEAFREGARRQCAAIRIGVASGNAKIVGDATHSLKSGARSIGAMRLSTLCDDMNISAEAGRSAELHAQLARFEAEMTAVHRVLDQEHLP